MKYIEVTFFTKPENIELLMGLLSQYEFDSFVENDIGFVGYIKKNEFDFLIEHNELDDINKIVPFTFESTEVEDKNWNEEWEKSFSPIQIDNKLFIRAPFHEKNNQVDLEIIIEPKMSFGTGHHSTTFLMAESMFDLEFENKTVLDMGCGTGLLAILASKLSANKVFAVDIDEWSYNNSIENCSLNSCENIEILQGDVEIIKEFPTFDIVLANINRNILLQDIPFYLNKLEEKGVLIISGFYSEDEQYFLDKQDEWGVTLIKRKERENWLCLMFQK